MADADLDATGFAARKFEYLALLRTATRLPAVTLCVGMALIDHYDWRDDGRATVSVSGLARAIGIASENPVRQALKHLEAVGLIIVARSTGGFGKAHRISMSFPSDLSDRLDAWSIAWRQEKQAKRSSGKNPSRMHEGKNPSPMHEGFRSEDDANPAPIGEGKNPSRMDEAETLHACVNPHSTSSPVRSSSAIGMSAEVHQDPPRLTSDHDLQDDYYRSAPTSDARGKGQKALPRPIRVERLDDEDLAEIHDEVCDLVGVTRSERADSKDLLRELLTVVNAGDLVAELQHLRSTRRLPSSLVAWLEGELA